ncbi:endonuclease G [bacterium A37T11]|nr:endonuclease G [bacterium A37T11]
MLIYPNRVKFLPKQSYFKISLMLFSCVLYACGKEDAIELKSNYIITEDFEGAAKKAYATGDVKLKTGTWTFDEALVYAVEADAKNGLESVRMRNNGSISTNFAIAGLKKVAVSSATFGTDISGSWQLYVARPGKGFEAVGNLVNVTSHNLKSDTISIAAVGPIKIRIKKSGGNRVNIDDVTFIGSGDSEIVIGEPGGDDTNNPSIELAPARGVNKGDDAPPSWGDNSNLLLGNPSNASGIVDAPNNYLVDNYYYTLSYSKDRGIPNWTSWHLDDSNFSGAASRQDDFAGYSGLPSDWYQVSNLSYAGSGFDRGHNCPSGDRTSSISANSATFLMVNMIPQAPKNNQGPWEELESDIREELGTTKEAYIIMGSYGEGGDGTYGTKTKIDNGNITVPAHVWKVAIILTKGNGDLIRIDANTKVIAVDMPNSNSVKTNWKQFKVSVDAIEAATGYELLSSLPDAVQYALEAKN